MGLSIWCSSIGRQLPHVDDVEAYALKSVGNIFCWRVWGKVTTYCLDRLFRIWSKGKVLEIIYVYLYIFIYMYRASLSPGSVRQIMPLFSVTSATRVV
jgi:hypothetical protein